ncbi:hypothetical protein ILUMI_24194 [Ignelater luminosus]|uniref:Uncharacterized protein n=1 Tax=Ignelater luminosus TaxID=2038154 RepID=A0A8K0C7I2_IGNLU|nr:hypothetical protein ILUMI_24194 [Ignelater luminosus]
MLGLIDKPKLIWNLDETSLLADPSKIKIVSLKGKPCFRTTSSSGRENTTVLSAVTALGGKADILERLIENVSAARALGLSREILQKYFKELEIILTKNYLSDKFGNIFNCDEICLQLNTRAGQVLAQKRSTCVLSISPGEKGDTISVLACYNVEGGYLPPDLIFKEKKIQNMNGAMEYLLDHQKYQQEPIGIQIHRRKWGWIGHALRQEANIISGQARDWNSQGSKRRSAPRKTWRRSLKNEIERLDKGYA